MDRKLVWTEKASSDIEAIVRYIARQRFQYERRIKRETKLAAFTSQADRIFLVTIEVLICGRCEHPG
jgi:plasmid stabilization system protein ParE